MAITIEIDHAKTRAQSRRGSGTAGRAAGRQGSDPKAQMGHPAADALDLLHHAVHSLESRAERAPTRRCCSILRTGVSTR